MALSRYGVALIAGVLFAGPIAAVAQQPEPQQPATTQQPATPQQAPATATPAATAPAATDPRNATPAPAATTPVPDAAAAPAAATDAAAPAAAPAADGTAPVTGAAVAAGDVSPGAAKDPNVDPSKPVVYDKHGKIKVKKEKPPKLIPVNIVHGELTVDGMIAKAGLNFQVLDIKYLYIWVPGLGTAIVSNHFFAGSKLEPNALDGTVLTIKVEGHQLQLACDHAMLEGKKPKPLSMYVALDKTYDRASNYPEFGYGDVSKAPYNWPGTLADLNPNTKAPPLPDNLKQKQQIVKICPKNADGSLGPCHETEVPLVLGKKS